MNRWLPIRVLSIRMQFGDIRGHTPTRARYTDTMPPRYIRASEVGTFVFCRRAWFLEHQHQPTDLSENPWAEARGPGPGNADRKSLSTARLSLFLLVLGIGGIACVALLATMRP
jgi:hypothetical protein